MLLSPCGHVRVSADQPLRVTISLSDVQAPAGAALVVREASSVVAGTGGNGNEICALYCVESYCSY